MKDIVKHGICMIAGATLSSCVYAYTNYKKDLKNEQILNYYKEILKKMNAEINILNEKIN